MIATFLQILTFFNPVPESTPSLFRHPYQKASLYPACPRFRLSHGFDLAHGPASLLPPTHNGLSQGSWACSPSFSTVRPTNTSTSHLSAPPPTRSSPGPLRLSCVPHSLRCPRPRSFTRRLQDASRSPRTWRPGLLHPPTTLLPPSRHFRPQRPYAQPFPVVRQDASG